MHDQERLARVESEVELIKVGFGEVKSALMQLASNMQQLSLAILDQAASEQRRVEAQLKDSRRWLWEIAKLGLAGAGGLALSKMGVHPL